MNIKLETERLYLREFTLEDAEILYNMHLDPAITRYTGDPFPWASVDHAREILGHTILPQYEKGVGRWAAHLKENDAFIGWCGLKDTGAEVDLGYRFLQQYWGNGYATESATAVLQYGVKRNIQNIVGNADIENKASVKVLGRIGLTFQKYYTEENGSDCIKFVYKY